MEKMQKIKKYSCTCYHDSTGSSSTSNYPFLQEHFEMIGQNFDPQGVDLISAKRIIELLNKRGDKGSIRYRYSLI